MTKVPFDWDTFLNNKVIVKLDSRKMAEEFLSHFKLIPGDRTHKEENLLSLIEQQFDDPLDGFRFNRCTFLGHGTFRLYPEVGRWNEYLMMEYDYSSPDGITVEVGDLL